MANSSRPVDFDAVLDEFKRQDQAWAGIAIVEAVLNGIRAYRWMPDGVLGVTGNCRLTLRPATIHEYADLEQGIANGQVSITRHNRISRETATIHHNG